VKLDINYGTTCPEFTKNVTVDHKVKTNDISQA